MTVRKDEKRGTHYFVVDVPGIGGKRQQVRRRGFTSPTAARRAERAFLASLGDGKYAPLTSDTLGSFLVKRWMPAKLDKVRESTALGYEKAIATRIVPNIGAVRLRDLDTPMLEAFYADLVKSGGEGGRGLSPKTVANVAGVLSSALGDAVRWKLIAANPAKGARLPRRNRVEMKTWTEQEAATFLEYVRTDRRFPLWRLALATGLRRGELCGLRWIDLDLDAATVTVANTRVQARTVVEGEPKTISSRRTIALDADTVAALRSWKARQSKERLSAGEAWQDLGYVFVDEMGKPPHPETVSGWWRATVEAAGVSTIRLHDARHTAATLLLRSRVPLKVVSERLGHADVAVTMRVYQHVSPADDQHAADVLGNVLGGRV